MLDALFGDPMGTLDRMIEDAIVEKEGWTDYYEDMAENENEQAFFDAAAVYGM